MIYPLHEETLKLVKEERRLTGLVIESLQKIADQKLFLAMGFSSLFEYCTRALGYSESGAYRRVSAVKVVREIPEIKTKLNDGSLNLTNLSMAQNLFAKKCFSTDEKREVLGKIENCSKRQAEQALISMAPDVPLKSKESLRSISADESSLHVRLSNQTVRNLDRIKQLRSHKNPKMNYGDLIADMCQYILKKLAPDHKGSAQGREHPVNQKGPGRVEAKDEPVTTTGGEMPRHKPKNVNGLDSTSSGEPTIQDQHRPSRFISKAIKLRVYQRDQGQCSYQDPNSMRRCESRHLLQYDHIQPFRNGGPNHVDNLRLLCHAHHRLRDHVATVF